MISLSTRTTMTTKKTTPPAPVELKEACVIAAQEVIAEHGVENLSLRDVARKLGVSHQAPYKHYPTREHLLAEVMRRCYEQFTAHLNARSLDPDPKVEMHALGQQYLSFALSHPLEYRLMFNTPWPKTAEQPELVDHANQAFDTLRRVMARVHGVKSTTQAVDLDALFVWSTMHGLAGILSANCTTHLTLAPTVHKKAVAHVMGLIERGLSDPTR
jgi:AcrR family transcriptional regulator